MANNSAYTPTTESNDTNSWFTLPNNLLTWPRAVVKLLEVVFSLVAFILEETVVSCLACPALYFFEFISCSALLFTMLLLILLSTQLHNKVNVNYWPQLDFIYTAGMALFFFISSCVFAAHNSRRSVESAAVTFGFLATAAFICDFALIMKSGNPFERKTPGNEDVSGSKVENDGLPNNV